MSELILPKIILNEAKLFDGGFKIKQNFWERSFSSNKFSIHRYNLKDDFKMEW